MEIAIVPRFLIRKFLPDGTDQIHANVLLTSMLIIVVLVLWQRNHAFFSRLDLNFCFFERFLDMHPPGCGVTRSLLAIAGGNISSAWNFNPAGLLVFAFILAQIPLRVTALKFPASGVRVFRISRLGTWVVIAAVILVWIIRLAQ
ncbi:MAG: DUF2752 domain-containing protein [Chloroflexi bacterium]|nr:DUF2752 domain-containing protein [Chloroflexota bacterium]